MKTLKISGAILLALGILLTLGVLVASADGPVAYLDNASHTLAANASAMYRFDYALNNQTGEHPITTITLPNGTNGNLGFQVWTADTINDMADNHPVGIGTPQGIDCNTGVLNGSGGCLSPDLTWTGAFGSGGPYYVVVTNNGSTQASYQLKIQGSGVSLGQQMATTLGAPAAAPALPGAAADDPAKAVAIDAKQHSLPANSAAWYSFNYGVLDDGTHPLSTITLVNGNQPGLGFQVYSPETMTGGWWNNNPTGQGTAASIDCGTGEVMGQGGCSSNDLTWTGAFANNGTYFIRVWNSTNTPMNYTLTIQ